MHKYLIGKCAACILLVWCTLNATAQQEWSYSQYLFNLYDINAAYAGNHGAPSFALRYRAQWMGMQGAPTSQQLSAHTPLIDGKMGAGLRILNEQIGLRNQLTARVNGAYKLQLGERTLSFGLAAGAVRNQWRADDALVHDDEDTKLSSMQQATITPMVDAALFLHTDTYYAGIEANRLNRSKTNDGEGSLERLYYNMNLTAGYMIKGISKTSTDDLLQLSTLIKFSEGNIYQAELNVLFLKNNKYWFGGGYRYPTSGQIMACLNLSSQWRFGLSYDIPLAAQAIQRSGSGEAFLGFNLKPNNDKSIRYF
ncbi:MAG: PorP/SprF family type IX secretion system membrane protein [Flavobacteriales bacterium]